MSTPPSPQEESAVMSVQADEHRRLFYIEIDKALEKGDHISKPITVDSYYTKLDIVKRFRSGISKSVLRKENPQAYAIIKKFDIISISSRDLLVIKPTPDEEHSIATHKRVSNYATIFDDIRAAHIPAHEKRVTLHNKCNLSYGDSIPLHACIAFGDTCPVCLNRENRRKPKAGSTPIVTKGYGNRGQIDLIDMQSMPDGSFKFICHYSDHGIKFGAAGALIQKTCRAVALFLFDLFTLIGPPKTLQSDNGREFSNVALEGKAQKVYLDEEFMDNVITELAMLWPTCGVICGTPRHSESNGGIERRNRTFEERLGACMVQYKTKHWSVMLKLVVWSVNTSWHKGIKDIPYRSLTGQNPSCGISGILMDEALHKTRSEEEFIAIGSWYR
eukprot:scaffold20361_cov46-Cyclotella_meneghiniana.AAC.3